MRDRFNQFMMGRYGNDQFNRFLFIVTLICLAVNIFTRSSIPFYIAIIIFIWCYFRMFSRNIEKRYAENERYLRVRDAVTGIFKRNGSRGQSRSDWKYYKIFRCPQCKQKIRIPRGKGRVRIRCPKCGNTFIKKT